MDITYNAITSDSFVSKFSQIDNWFHDSRKVVLNSVYWAFSGVESDINSFVEQAILMKPAVLVVDSLKNIPFTFEGQICLVPDTKVFFVECLNQLNLLDKTSIFGVTGTNGKTSVCWFLQQLMVFSSKKSLYVGTLGVYDGLEKKSESKLTTPHLFDLVKEYINLKDSLGEKEEIDLINLELSSHGLDQNRLFNINLDCFAYTNLSQDHLDYHENMEEYLCSKLKVTKQLKPMGYALLNGDDGKSDQFFQGLTELQQKNAIMITEKISNQEKKIGGIQYRIMDSGLWGQRVEVQYKEESFEFKTAIIGDFHISNILLSVSSYLHLFKSEFKDVVDHLSLLRAPLGRLQRVNSHKDSFHVFVDYAHTPDALEKTLKSVKNSMTSKKGELHLVFGCGGDRDQTKRKLMGKVASQFSDKLYVTSDNPRTEDPLKILSHIEDGIVSIGQEVHFKYELIEKRELAIEKAIKELGEGDCLIIAGKGHENYQIYGDTRVPFDDVEVAKRYL